MSDLAPAALSIRFESLPPVGLFGVLLLIASILHVFIEHRACYSRPKVLEQLDKAWITVRVRALLRSAVLIGWASLAFGWAVAASVFFAALAMQMMASYVRYCLEKMTSLAPIRPVLNLKSFTRYQKVWGKLPQLKKVRTRLLMAGDVLALMLVAAVWVAGESFDLAGNAKLAATAIALLVLVLVAGAATAKTGRRKQAFMAADVPNRVQNKIVGELKAFKPQIVVYFTGNPADRYQLEQWLEPIGKLKKRVVIVLRENGNAAKFPECKWPVVVARTVDQLEQAIVPSIKVALYVSNAAKNMHLLRNGDIKHVHLNHGDSDKASSANRFCQVYDALFVAGPAGLKRYLDVGFDAEQPRIIQVGRPQLDSLQAKAKKKRTKVASILYAPTWEGMARSVNYSSMATLGVSLVEEVAKRKDLKLIVRAHPNTGRNSVEMAEALATIRRLAKEHANIELASSKTNILADFKRTDVMVSDVSAVVSDFLVTDRPVIMTRPSHTKAANFASEFPLSSAASVVGNGNAAEVLKAVKAALTSDPKAKARRRKTREVHGNHPYGPQHAFEKAIDNIITGLPNRNLKILLTLNTLGLGGAERDCLELSKALAERGHQVSVFAQDGYLRNKLDSRVGFIERPAGRLAAAIEMRRLANQFDVINTNDLQPLLALADESHNAKILSTIHNIGSRRNDPIARRLLQKVPDKVVFFSSSEQKRLFDGETKVGTVARPGIEIPGRSATANKSKTQANMLLFCGRLSHERGADRAIRAMQHLPKFKLRIVGDGPLEMELKQLAADVGVASRVEFAGPTANPFGAISQAAVVLVPSRRDALPRIVREAAALDKKIVASELDGVRESAGSYKRIKYCDPEDPKTFADTINSYASKKESKSTAGSKPSAWAAMVKKIEDLADSEPSSRNSEATKEHKSKKVDAAKASGKRKEKAKNRHFDRVRQIVEEQKQRTWQTVRARTWDGERQKPQDIQNPAENKPLTAEQLDELFDDSEISLPLLHEADGVPGSGEGQKRFDDQVPEKVEAFAKERSFASPTSQLAVSAVAEQVDLTGYNGNGGSPQIAEPDKKGSAYASSHHQQRKQMMVERKLTDSPSQLRRDPSAVDSAGPVLASVAVGQGDIAEGVEASVSGTRSGHRLDPIIESALKAEPRQTLLVDSPGTPVEAAPRVAEPRPAPIRKANDGLLATYVAAPLAERIVRRVPFDKVKPNHITLASTALSFVGARLISRGTMPVKIAGVSALGAGFVLDCADGQLARLRGEHSDLGMRLDEISDRCAEMYLISELARKSGKTFGGDAAAVLMLTRHVLSRLETTKLVATGDPNNRRQGFDKNLRSLAQLTIGDRLAAVACASLVSSARGADMFCVLGATGVAKDLAARHIRDSKSRPAAYATCVGVAIGGALAAFKYPGKAPLLAIVPYVYLAARKQRQNLTLS